LVVTLTSSAWAQVPANEDVGNPAVAGSLAYDPVADSWSVTGAGGDIWGSSDQFHFVFRPLVGDGEGVVRVASMDCAHEWSKVGVMIRESLASNSKHVMVAATGAHGVQTVWRPETGGDSQGATTEGVALPLWVKITRTGDTIMTAMTWDPAFWIPQQTLSVPMNETVYIGMFVCSHQAGTACTAVFDNVDLTAPLYPFAWNVSPPDGALVDARGVTISWMPGDTAASHNVYLGTTSPPDLVVNQAETSYDTGALEAGVTYYYRIDEVEADGTTIHEGQERSFNTKRAGTGTILREVWEGIGGTVVSDLTNNANYPANPSYSDEVTLLEAPTDFADNFGSRLHGWLLPETSGDYTFWIASDDSSNLYLSSDENPANAVVICGVDGWTSSRNFDGTAGAPGDRQMSDPVALEAGQMYYISAIYKEGGGGDNVAVAWEGPDSPTRSVIDGYFLMPFENLWAWDPSPADGATGVAMAPTLSWLPAVDAVSYDVYVDGAMLGNTAETSMPAGPFALSEDLHPSTHTWRVDVVTDSEVRTGNVWSFTVTNNRIIDDFEAYDIIPVATPKQTVVGGDYTIAAEAPPAQSMGGDYTIPGYTEVEAVDPGAEGLVALYEFENDTTDSSGNGNDGTYDGVPVFVPGAPDGLNPTSAIQFDGQGPQRVEVQPIDVVGGGITLACWFKTSNLDTPGSDPRVISKAVGGANDEHWFMVSSSRVGDDKVLRFRLKTDDGTTSELKAGAPDGIIPLDVWTHMAATWDGSTMRLYKNGVEVGSMAKTGTAVATNPDLPMSIGNQPSITDSRPWDGLIDDVRIYNRGLSEGEVRYLAGVGDLAVDPIYVPPFQTPLRLHLEFEGDATDSSGNGHHGTLMGDASIVDGALVLDGDGDYVNIDGYKGINAVDGVQQPFTIANWFKTTSESGNTEMVTWGSSPGTQRLTWRVHEGRLRTEHGSGNLRGNTYVNDGEWHHGALVVTEGANLRVPNTLLYVDGVQDSTFSGSDNAYNLTPDVDVRIGMGGPTGDRFWPGSIDDVRIYDYALSEGEIRYLADVGDKYVPPVYGPMRLHLEFEGDYSDDSGNGNDGTPVGDITFEDDPVMGQVVSLPGGDNQFVEVGSVGLSGNDQTTIACWAKADHTDIPDWTLIFGFTTEGGGNGSHFNVGSLGGPGGVGAHCWGWEETIFSDQEALDWHHYAMTYDGTTITYYGDGVYMDTDTGKSNVQDLSIRADNVHVGSRITQASSFPGKVDDARIYDYAMSDAEIAGLAGYVPTNPITDTWSDFGFVEMEIDAGTMKVESFGLPGLPYYIGDVSRTLPFADLSAGGGKALSVWFQGDAANATEFMYMMLADGDGQSDMVLYNGDAADLASDEWQEWNVDMRDFEGVDPANADEITIGLAGLDGSADGDVMNFDNIRVYSGRCMPDLRKPAVDLNDDCIVDVGDLEEIIADWGETTLTYTITANGGDIWGSADAFHYMYQEMSGDAEAVVQLTELLGPGTNAWAKGGIMIRETLDAGSRNAFVAITGGNGDGATFQWRPEPDDGSSSSRTLAGISPPASVKLVREGDTFTGYVLMDGEWQQEGDSATVVMTDPVYIGLALTSHESGVMRTAKLNSLVINGVAEPELTGVDIGDTLAGSSDRALILSHADLNEDAVVDWTDVFIMLDSWLEEQLWPY
jgi:regulation of enolase protein 1 (concanavalin A-like superfamily)